MQVHHEVVCEFGDGQLKIRLAVVPAEVSDWIFAFG